MATKRPSKPPAKPVAKTSPKKLQNLAAKPPSFDDTIDEQLVDNSGVFRVTTAIARDQIGHEDDSNPRFANDSLVMQAQRDGFRDDTIEEPVDSELAIEDEATAAAKRQRLATLAALAAQKKRR